MKPGALVVAVQKAHGGAAPPVRDIRRWARAALGGEAGSAELTVRIVGEHASAALNERYRRHRGPTNVLALDAVPIGEIGLGALPALGDVVICGPVVVREAHEQGKAVAAHWAHMVVHGALHLAGYDHEEEAAAARMEGRERLILAALGFPDPYEDRPAA